MTHTVRDYVKSIIRGELRHRGIEPTEATQDQIIRTLDERARKPGPVRHYYLNASDKAITRFANEIRRGIR